MSDQNTKVQATVMFDDMMAFDYVDLINELQRPFRNISLEFEQTAMAPDTCAVFINENMVVRIGIATGNEDELAANAAGRPERSRFSSDMVDALLEDVQDHIVVSVEDGPAGSASEAMKLTVCYHATRHLLNQPEACLVHWSHTNTLYVSDEFDVPVGLGYTPQPQRPQKKPATVTLLRPAAAAAEAASAASTHFGGSHLAVADTHNRLDEQLMNVVRPSPMRHDAEEELNKVVSVDPAREEDRLRRARGRIFAGDLIENTLSQRHTQQKSIGTLQQIAVYLMTITILVLSFPIGFIMLVYNLVRGESMNATARVMALTGVGVGVTSDLAISQALSFLV